LEAERQRSSGGYVQQGQVQWGTCPGRVEHRAVLEVRQDRMGGGWTGYFGAAGRGDL